MAIGQANRAPVPATTARFSAYVPPAIAALIVVSLSAPRWIKTLATDDALYYPTVARNIASGLGSTYDGVTPTNGYHPLWCWLQVPIAYLTRSLDSMTYLWIVKVLMVIVVVLAIVVWERTVHRITGSRWVSTTFVLLLGGYWWSVHTLYSGMETPLVVLLMGVSLLLAHKLIQGLSVRTAVGLGVAMAGTLLARLDSVFFLGILGLVVLIRLRRYARLLAAWLVPMIALPIPYLWWNLANFGSLVPVSGIRKSSAGAGATAQLDILWGFVTGKVDKFVDVLHPIGAVLALILLILAICAMWVIRDHIREHLGKLGVLWALPIGACLHFLYIATFMVEADVSWYQYAEYLTVFLAASIVVAASVSWLQARGARPVITWLPFGVVLLAVVVSVVGFAPKAIPDVTNRRSYDAAVWANKHLSAGDPHFGMYDPGVFTFVSGFHVVALNGLASTREVTDLVREQNWTEIIRRYDIRYVVVFVADEDIGTIPPNHIRYRTNSFDKYLWRYDEKKQGRYLIVDSSYGGLNDLI